MILFRPFYGIVLVLWGVVAILGDVDGIQGQNSVALHFRRVE